MVTRHLSHDEDAYFGRNTAYEDEKNRRRLDRIERALQGLAGRRLLEVGVAYGAFLLAARERGMHVRGLELESSLAARANEHLGEDAVLVGNAAEPWPFEDESFDVIAMFDVLEHLESPRLGIDHAKRLLTPGGVLMMTTPNDGLGYALRRLPVFGIPDRNPGHISVAPPDTWRHAMTAAGLEIVDDWYGEHLGHLRGLTRLDMLAKRFGADPSRWSLFDPLQLSIGLVARRPAG
ncbi:MAG: class I SAM-dependent methyltransferase [Deltaproteobacteria bacterium]